MHLYLFRHSFLEPYAVAPWLTWAILIGAGYGVVRLVRDALSAMLPAWGWERIDPLRARVDALEKAVDALLDEGESPK